ncbi:MAG: glycosyltransferase family 39 protein [Candidatus Latescibacterota bacterium]|nr:glycosyltransferase family 39 protein [Candidatus Latescibacterota bacterium]
MVDIVYIVAIAIVAAVGGLTLLRRIGPICQSRAEELIFSLGFGLGVLALGVLALGFMHLLYAEVLYGLLALGALIGSRELVGLAARLQGYLRGARLEWRSFHFWLLVLAGIGLFLNLLRALLPAHGAVDPLAYHLALPRLYLLRHHIGFERTLTGALYPDNVGMLFLLSIGLRDASLAQVMHWFMGGATVVALWCFCRRYFDGRVGAWAIAAFSFTPVFVFFAPLSYVDIGVGFFQFLGLWALYKWLQEGGHRSLMLAAVFMGLAMGSKHTGIFLALAGALVVAGHSLYRREGAGATVLSLALYGSIAVGLASPWYLRALWESGNPVWPVANGLFGGLPYGGGYSISAGVVGAQPVDFGVRALDLAHAVATSLWHWAWDSSLGWQRATGIYFLALVPGALLYWRVSVLRWLIAAGLAYYLIAVLYVDGNPRYNIALLALLSILAGYVAERLGRQRQLLVGMVFKVVFVGTLVANLGQGYAWSYQGLQYALSPQTPQGFLLENEDNYQAFHFVDKYLPADAKVLLQGIVKGYYCSRPYMWDHPYQMLLQYGDYPTSESLLEKMGQLGITHIVRMIYVPPGREILGYPQYFADALQEEFRKKYLKLLYRDQRYVVFEVVYPS